MEMRHQRLGHAAGMARLVHHQDALAALHRRFQRLFRKGRQPARIHDPR